MLHGPLAHHGYDWWWHSLTAQDAETGEELFLSDGVREQYGEQHLRLGTSLMQTLIDKGFACADHNPVQLTVTMEP